VSSTPTTTLRSSPRWATPRRLERPTRGGLDRQVAALLGWTLFPWQADTVDVAGEYHSGSKIPVYRTVGVAVARQNGKTTLICARIARQLIPPRQTVAYTAQDRGLARTKWAEHVELLLSTPFADRVERVERTNHREVLVMQNGSRYMPVTPTAKKAARSLSIDLAVVDEAHAHPDMGVAAAIQPAMAARPNAQMWLLSNAGISTSGLWRHYTDVGRLEAENPASTMCWIEYAADPDADAFDRKAWAAANPSLGLPGGVLEMALSDGALTMDRTTFFREHLNVWMDGDALNNIDEVIWGACRRDDLMPGTEIALGYDFTPERDHGSLVVAGRTEAGPVALEILESGPDLDRIVQRAAEVANTWDAIITVDRGSPGSSSVATLERLTARPDGTNRVRLIPLTEFVRSCGDFHDAAVHGQVSHRGDYRLTDSVLGATKRSVSDAWAWRRRGEALGRPDASDITPLIAATLARWGVVAAPEPLRPAVY
jgi:hypothetical protein